jgi:hypothetical protein
VRDALIHGSSTRHRARSRFDARYAVVHDDRAWKSREIDWIARHKLLRDDLDNVSFVLPSRDRELDFDAFIVSRVGPNDERVVPTVFESRVRHLTTSSRNARVFARILGSCRHSTRENVTRACTEVVSKCTRKRAVSVRDAVVSGGNA